MGRASPIASGPPHIEPRGSSLPIENSPPGIHTMPSGAGVGGGAWFGIVAANAEVERGWDGVTTAELVEVGCLKLIQRRISNEIMATAAAASNHFHCLLRTCFCASRDVAFVARLIMVVPVCQRCEFLKCQPDLRAIAEAVSRDSKLRAQFLMAEVGRLNLYLLGGCVEKRLRKVVRAVGKVAEGQS